MKSYIGGEKEYFLIFCLFLFFFFFFDHYPTSIKYK